MDEEIWKQISGCEVSNKGRVRYKGKIKPLSLTGKYAKEGRGYLATRVNGLLLKVHRLVALAFIKNPSGLPMVNHKNGITTDNNLVNLEWINASGNQTYAIASGLKVPVKGVAVGTCKFSEETILKCLELRLQGIGQREVAKITGVSKTQIGRIERGESWQHLTNINKPQ